MGLYVLVIKPFIKTRLLSSYYGTEPLASSSGNRSANRSDARTSSRSSGGIHLPPPRRSVPINLRPMDFGLVPDGALPFAPLARAHPRLAAIY